MKMIVSRLALLGALWGSLSNAHALSIVEASVPIQLQTPCRTGQVPSGSVSLGCRAVTASAYAQNGQVGVSVDLTGRVGAGTPAAINAISEIPMIATEVKPSEEGVSRHKSSTTYLCRGALGLFRINHQLQEEKPSWQTI
jgi:hypothetical protein